MSAFSLISVFVSGNPDSRPLCGNLISDKVPGVFNVSFRCFYRAQRPQTKLQTFHVTLNFESTTSVL